MPDVMWQKSSFSSGNINGDCVELARGPEGGRVWLRESAEPGMVLIASTRRVEALLRQLKAQEA